MSDNQDAGISSPLNPSVTTKRPCQLWPSVPSIENVSESTAPDLLELDALL